MSEDRTATGGGQAAQASQRDPAEGASTQGRADTDRSEEGTPSSGPRSTQDPAEGAPESG
jgi:hypothetical protein